MATNLTTNQTTLKELRTGLGLTQVELGKKIGVIQRRISTIENSDPNILQLSTLRSYVEGLGGHLRVTVSINGTEHTIA